jgi:serine/threonine protein kinase
MTGCLSAPEIDELLSGSLSPAQQQRAADHLAACPPCRQRLEAERLARQPTLDPPARDLPETACAATSPEGPFRVPSIPGYEVLAEIHRGGQGVVYRAVQKPTRRTVALKVLPQGPYATPQQRLRFEREIDLVAGLRHPHIVTLFDSGVTPEGFHYFAMEYIDGVPLNRYSFRDGREALAEVLRLFVAICAAVNHAHQRGVIHRDLKPGNICIDGDGQPHVLDFGLATTAAADQTTDGSRLTVAGAFLGTPGYAAPEQAGGDPQRIDARTDVYALGVILYELLTGQLPYPVKGSLLEFLAAVAEAEPEPPSVWRARAAGAGAGPPYRVDGLLEAIVLKALARDPERRYQSAGALAEDVTHYLAGEPIQARPPSLALLLRMWLRHNLRATLWTGVIGVACGALSPLGLNLLWHARTLSELAEAYRAFPGLQPPILAHVPWASTPGWLIAVLNVLGPLAFFGMGWFTVLLVRPRSQGDDLVAGAATGLIGGVTAFALYFGESAVLALTVLPAQEDMQLLIQPGSERLLQKYPDLGALPEDQRADALVRKTAADMLFTLPGGIVLGIYYTLSWFGGGALVGTLAAGYLWRRGGKWYTLVLPYLELTLSIAALVVMLAAVVGKTISARPWGVAFSPALVLAILGAQALFAWKAVPGRWHPLLRLSLYAACFVLLLRAFGVGLPWYVDVSVGASAAVVLGWRLHHRHAPAAGDPTPG